MSVLGHLLYRHNAPLAADQDYELAKRHYLDVIDSLDSRCPDCVERLHAASYRRRAAFELFMRLKFGPGASSADHLQIECAAR